MYCSLSSNFRRLKVVRLAFPLLLAVSGSILLLLWVLSLLPRYWIVGLSVYSFFRAPGSHVLRIHKCIL